MFGGSKLALREDEMKNIIRLTVLGTVFALTVLPALADTLILKSGDKVTGYYEGGSARVVKFRLADGSVKDYDILTVQTIQFGDEKSAATAAPKAGGTSESARNAAIASPSGMPQLAPASSRPPANPPS